MPSSTLSPPSPSPSPSSSLDNHLSTSTDLLALSHVRSRSTTMSSQQQQQQQQQTNPCLVLAASSLSPLRSHPPLTASPVHLEKSQLVEIQQHPVEQIASRHEEATSHTIKSSSTPIQESNSCAGQSFESLPLNNSQESHPHSHPANANSSSLSSRRLSSTSQDLRLVSSSSSLVELTLRDNETAAARVQNRSDASRSEFSHTSVSVTSVAQTSVTRQAFARLQTPVASHSVRSSLTSSSDEDDCRQPQFTPISVHNHQPNSHAAHSAEGHSHHAHKHRSSRGRSFRFAHSVKKFLGSQSVAHSVGRRLIQSSLGADGVQLMRVIKRLVSLHTGSLQEGAECKHALLKLAVKLRLMIDSSLLSPDEFAPMSRPVLELACATLIALQSPLNRVEPLRHRTNSVADHEDEGGSHQARPFQNALSNVLEPQRDSLTPLHLARLDHSAALSPSPPLLQPQPQASQSAALTAARGFAPLSSASARLIDAQSLHRQMTALGQYIASLMSPHMTQHNVDLLHRLNATCSDVSLIGALIAACKPRSAATAASPPHPMSTCVYALRQCLSQLCVQHSQLSIRELQLVNATLCCTPGCSRVRLQPFSALSFTGSSHCSVHHDAIFKHLVAHPSVEHFLSSDGALYAPFVHDVGSALSPHIIRLQLTLRHYRSSRQSVRAIYAREIAKKYLCRRQATHFVSLCIFNQESGANQINGGSVQQLESSASQSGAALHLESQLHKLCCPSHSPPHDGFNSPPPLLNQHHQHHHQFGVHPSFDSCASPLLSSSERDALMLQCELDASAQLAQFFDQQWSQSRQFHDYLVAYRAPNIDAGQTHSPPD